MGEAGTFGVLYQKHMGSSKEPQDDIRPMQVLLGVMERLGLPVFLFGFLFLILTTALTFVLTPDRFPVRIGDRVVRLIDLKDEQKKLLSEKANLTAKEIAVPDSRAPVLRQLALLKPRVTSVGTVLLAIDDVRLRFKTDTVDPVSLPQITVNGSGTVITLGGVVKDSGASTMRTLASFVDGLRSIPSVLSVSEPEYTEKKDTDGVSLSPFSIVITLPHAAS